MTDPIETRLGEAIRSGDQAAFEQAYDRFRQRVRLIAWGVSHRADWVDDLVNEAWCRAFGQRTSYRPEVPFPVWMSGIVQNVYREQCRRSRTAAEARPDIGVLRAAGQGTESSPEEIAAEAELLEGLNDCVSRLSAEDARIVELRFFKGMPLRSVAKEVGIPESTLREVRLPAAYQALRRCLERRGISVPHLFPAQGGGESQ